MKKLHLLYRHRGILLLLVCLLAMGTFTGISADSRTVPGDPVRMADPDVSSGYAFPQISLSVPKVPELAPKQQQQQQQQIEIFKITKTSEPESDDTFKFRVKISPKIFWAGDCWEPLSVTDEALSSDSIPESKGISISDYYSCAAYIWSAIEHPYNVFFPNMSNKSYIQLAYKIIDSTGESDITPYHIIDNDKDFEKSIKFQDADELFNFLSLYESRPYVDEKYVSELIKNHYKKNPELDIGYVYFEEKIELKTGQSVAFYIMSTPFWVYRNISDLLTVEVEEIYTGGYIPDENPQSEPVNVNISPDTKPVEITFHNTKPQVTISAEKTWVDFDNKNGIRPNEVTLMILANGQDTNERLTLKAPDWQASSGPLPKIGSDGKTIDYSLEEFVPKGYTQSITEDPVNVFTVTNTLETVDISGKKSWSVPYADYIPESVTVELLGAEEKLVETKTVTAADNWQYEFKDLNKYDKNGVEIDYQVIEKPIKDFIRDPQTADGYDITNIYSPGMEDLPVIKVWDDEDDQDGIRPSSVTVQLYADGVPVEGQTLTLDSSNHWKGLFVIPLDGRTYTVQETGAPFDGYNQPVITGSQQEGYTITNTHVPETTSVTVQKIWEDDNDQDGKRPPEITVQLFADGEEVPGKRAVLNSDGDWSFIFTDLPKFAIAGKEIRYTISEFPDPDGYEKSEPEISVTDNGTFITITNTHEPKKISVKVTKVWEDEENADGSRPDSVTVNLKIGDEIIETIVLSERNKWTSSFSEMYEYEEGSLIEFTVEEDQVPDGYFSFITGDQEEGFKITNMHTPETVINIPVVKIWENQNDKNGLRPESVTVVLRGDDGSVYTAELSASNNWAHTFEKLKKYDPDGIEITYSLEELRVPEGYTSSISRDEDGSFVITNRLNEETPPDHPRLIRLECIELPKTGITGFPRMKKPASVKYTPTAMELFIPALNVSSEIVGVAQLDGSYPVEWLGMDAGLLEGTAIPGEGISVIAAHNTLNAEEYGPFALLASMEEGDRFFVRNGEDLLIYAVYANGKIASSDVAALIDAASAYDNTLTLLTCEDELPEGGYASRRIVSGRLIKQ